MDHSAPSGHQVDIVEMLSSQVKDISLKKQIKRKGPKHEQNKNRLIEHLQKLSEDELALIVAKRSIKKCSEGMATGFNTPKFYSEKFNQFLNRVKESPDEFKQLLLSSFSKEEIQNILLEKKPSRSISSTHAHQLPSLAGIVF